MIYTIWIAGPYLRSIIVRDAAITTWISVVGSPIEGYFDTNPLYPGTRAGPDGRIATIENPMADATPVAKAEAQLALAKERVTSLEAVTTSLQLAIDVRSKAAEAYADAYKRDIDERVAISIANIAHVEKRLELERVESGRLEKLSKIGHASQAAADKTAGAVIDLERLLATLKGELKRARVRQEAAKYGVLMLDDGEDGSAVLRSLEEMRLTLDRSKSDLEAAKVDARTAEQVLEETKAAFARARRMDIEAQPGAMVWSLIASPGAPVQAGSPVMSWIDCSIMLVDVPVSDVEMALLSSGDPADVVIEGEHDIRHGTVLLERGAAATIGQQDLAAVAKGRSPGVGQVLVKLEPTLADVEACPVGHAAYVDFPGVGVLDIVRARLRL